VREPVFPRRFRRARGACATRGGVVPTTPLRAKVSICGKPSEIGGGRGLSNVEKSPIIIDDPDDVALPLCGEGTGEPSHVPNLSEILHEKGSSDMVQRLHLPRKIGRSDVKPRFERVPTGFFAVEEQAEKTIHIVRRLTLTRINELIEPNTFSIHMPSKSKPVKKKNAAAVALSQLGSSKGGKARASKLSPQRRSEIAQKGNQAWMKKTTREQRSQAARKAVFARWNKRK
jgi:hypothetical protein